MIRRKAWAVFFLASAPWAAACVDGTLPRRSAQHPGNSNAPEGYPAAPLTALAEESKQDPTGVATKDADATAYVCPMHAEVVSKAPGTCPRCSMKLVPQSSRPKQAPTP